MTEWREENTSDDPHDFIPDVMEISPDEVIDIAKDSTTLLEVTKKTRLTRHQVRRIIILKEDASVASVLGSNRKDGAL